MKINDKRNMSYDYEPIFLSVIVDQNYLVKKLKKIYNNKWWEKSELRLSTHFFCRWSWLRNYLVKKLKKIYENKW